MVKPTLSLIAAASVLATSTAFQPISNVVSNQQILKAAPKLTTPLFMSDDNDGGVSFYQADLLVLHTQILSSLF